MEKSRSPHPSPLPKGKGIRLAWLLVVLLLFLATGSLCAQEDETYTDDDTLSVLTNESYLKNPGWYLRNIDSSKIPTGILIDRAKFRKDMGLFNGKSRVKTCDYAIFRRVLNHLRRAANDSVNFPNMDSIYKFAYDQMRWQRICPIAILNYKYNKIKRKAINDILVNDSDTVITVNNYENIFSTRRAILASPFDLRVHGNSIPFVFYRNMYFTNDKDFNIEKIEADFGDGWKIFNWDEPQIITFGSKTDYIEVKIKLFTSIDSTGKQRKLFSHFTILRSGSDLVPEPSEIITSNSNKKSTIIPANITAYSPLSKVYRYCVKWVNNDFNGPCETYRYDHSDCDIEYSIWFAPDNDSPSTARKLRKPIIVCDGFDPGDKRNYWQTFIEDPSETDLKKVDSRGIFQIMNGEKSAWTRNNDPGATLVQDLLNNGYDIVIVNWLKGDGDIIANADALRYFLNNTINTPSYRDNKTEEIILIGPSMGGLITRYCLRTMEKAGEEHHVKLWFCFDSPQEGAYIPIGLQYTMLNFYFVLDGLDQFLLSYFIHDGKLKLKTKMDVLQSQAAKQMLIIHLNSLGSNEDEIRANYSNTDPKTFIPIIEKTNFYTTMHNLGYPLFSKNIAITNGGKEKLYSNDKKQITNFKIDPAYDMKGYKLDNSIYTRFFFGPGGTNMVNELFARHTVGYDNAPGGYNTSLYDFNQNDDNESMPNHNVDLYPEYAKACFINTVSAFGIVPTWENIYKTWDQIDVSETPFDDRYGMSAYGNEEHVRVSDLTSSLLQNDILAKERDDIKKPFPRTTPYTEAESKACLYTANKTVTFGGVSGNNFVFNATADIKITAGTSIKFKPGVKLLKGAKLSAKTGAVTNGSLKSGTMQEKPTVTYLSPNPFKDKVTDYSENGVQTGITQTTQENVNHCIFVYPNPANDFINIKFAGTDYAMASVRIKNIYGQVVMGNTIIAKGEKTIKIAQLQKGIYFIDISLSNTHVSEKLVKK